MALDHPDKVTKLAVLDIIPTHYIYTHVTIEFVQAYFHWFNYLRPAPGPEKELEASTAAQKARATSDVQIEYLRTSSTPESIHAMCEDYRAGASIDLKHDAADLSHPIACPLLVLWGERSPMGRFMTSCRSGANVAVRVTGKGLPGGHNLQEERSRRCLRGSLCFLEGLMMRTRVLAFSCALFSRRLGGVAALQEKGGEDETGPYEAVAGWPQPWAKAGYIWGSQPASSPNHRTGFFLAVRGELKLPATTGRGFNGIWGSLGERANSTQGGKCATVCWSSMAAAR
jgi:hypothetical protein